LLILDEPTNFLDLESVDSLIAACNKYKGALLLVSHNRDFLRKCAKQYLSVVPGQFALYNDLKTAERSTYTFIAEMEEGGKVGASALVNNPGGGSIHSSQKVNKDAPEHKGAEMVDGVRTLSISSSSSSAAPAKKAVAAAPVLTYAVNEICQALWTDGKFYKAKVNKLDGAKYNVTYMEYGNKASVPATSLKKAAPLPQGAKPAQPHAKALEKSMLASKK
jgi:energy-coupling factor transporter ATP-binding protein EcfA2